MCEFFHTLLIHIHNIYIKILDIFHLHATSPSCTCSLNIRFWSRLSLLIFPKSLQRRSPWVFCAGLTRALSPDEATTRQPPPPRRPIHPGYSAPDCRPPVANIMRCERARFKLNPLFVVRSYQGNGKFTPTKLT
jgi:hypothetical protein